MEITLIEAFINENALILIPTVYILGLFLKSLEFIKDKYIPVLLLCIAILLSFAVNGAGVDSLIQAVLCSGVAVYFNQVYKQLTAK